MPRYYWGEAVKFVVYLINRTPSRVIDFQTPQQRMQSLLSTPYLPNLEPRVFGCTTYVHNPKVLRTKLDPCATRCVFVVQTYRKGTDVMILTIKSYTSYWMSPSVRLNHFIQKKVLSFPLRGSNPAMNICYKRVTGTNLLSWKT